MVYDLASNKEQKIALRLNPKIQFGGLILAAYTVLRVVFHLNHD